MRAINKRTLKLFYPKEEGAMRNKSSSYPPSAVNGMRNRLFRAQGHQVNVTNGPKAITKRETFEQGANPVVHSELRRSGLLYCLTTSLTSEAICSMIGRGP